MGDTAANAFATEFYGALLVGKTVGRSLAAGRTKVLELQNSIDWADYIHYGNQSFSLKEARLSRRDRSKLSDQPGEVR